MIGYHEVDGKLESDEAYLTSVAAYMKLYAAIIQVCLYFCTLKSSQKKGKKKENKDVPVNVRLFEIFWLSLQTEITGIKNPHGLKEGWKWLAMFLNHLPANTSTAYALEAFLKAKYHSLTLSYV